jgi:hypothetical protein
MKEILKKLSKLIDKSPQYCYFSEPAGNDLIPALEKKYDIRLPESFKEFLKTHNGGFIALAEDVNETNIDDIAWNSNYILAVELIGELFQGVNIKTAGTDIRYIPFLHTSDGEYLGFRYPLEANESRVYDLWHEAPASDWAESVVYENFTDLLNDYIVKKGEIETLG